MRRLILIGLGTIAGTWILGAAPAPAAPGWGWPLAGRPVVLRAFDRPPMPYAAGHRGVDLVAAVGSPVRSAADGVLSFAGPVAGRGVVSVDSGSLRSSYEPVAGIAPVGRRVARGEQIGWLGAPTGHCGIGVSCLHWGVRRGSTYLDPFALLGAGPVRLLPLGPPPAGELRPPPVRLATSELGPQPDLVAPARPQPRAAGPGAWLLAAGGGLVLGALSVRAGRPP